MNKGRLIQVGSPSEIYERPNSRWVADFIGDVTLIEGRIAKGGGVIDSALGRLRADTAGGRPGHTAWLALRPEKLRLTMARPSGRNLNAVQGTVCDIGYRGSLSIYKVRVADESVMKVSVANAAGQVAAINDTVWLSWPADAGVVVTA
jgi:putrescine transport system ATP-binding protein